MKIICDECRQELILDLGQSIPHKGCSNCGCCLFIKIK